MEITPAWWKQNSGVPSWRKQMMHLLKFQKKCQMEWQVHQQKFLIDLLNQNGSVWVENAEYSPSSRKKNQKHGQLLS